MWFLNSLIKSTFFGDTVIKFSGYGQIYFMCVKKKALKERGSDNTEEKLELDKKTYLMIDMSLIAECVKSV
jgi:hypothetical protein